jgi:hypothetical protein
VDLHGARKGKMGLGGVKVRSLKYTQVFAKNFTVFSGTLACMVTRSFTDFFLNVRCLSRGEQFEVL